MIGFERSWPRLSASFCLLATSPKDVRYFREMKATLLWFLSHPSLQK
jgi:hypothetical protein